MLLRRPERPTLHHLERRNQHDTLPPVRYRRCCGDCARDSASGQAPTQEFEALQARAEHGDAAAQYELGCMHDVGCLDEAVLNNSLDLEIDALGDAEAARWSLPPVINRWRR